MLSSLAIYLIAFIFFELVANFIVFPQLNKRFTSAITNGKPSSNISPAWKGTMERLCLSTALVFGIHSILIAFGTLKIGTRLSNSEENKVAHDYYLLGNLSSIFVALIEYYAWQSHFFHLFCGG